LIHNACKDMMVFLKHLPEIFKKAIIIMQALRLKLDSLLKRVYCRNR
jgi:hypothetical protein